MKHFLFFLILLIPFALSAQSSGEMRSQLSPFSMTLGLPQTKWKWKGDIRVRAQQETTWSEDSRLSERLRLRFGMQTELMPDLKAEFRLATSKSNNSTNQTLGDNKEPGSARRFIGLDLAFAEWKATSFLKVFAGRTPQTHFRPGGSQVLLDSDLALEGVALASDFSFNESLGVFAAFGSSWIRENYDSYYSQEQTDNMLNWGQAGLKWSIEKWTTTVGLGFFNFTALQEMKFSDVSTGGTPRGNSESAPGAFKNNFAPRQYFAETKFKQGAYNFGGFVEYLINGETLDPNKAWWTGVSVSQETWSAQLAFAELQSDVVPGIFTDSDFSGGTTDTKGYVLSGVWKVRKHLSVGIAQYMTRKKGNLEDTQYARTHLDLSADF